MTNTKRFDTLAKNEGNVNYFKNQRLDLKLNYENREAVFENCVIEGEGIEIVCKSLRNCAVKGVKRIEAKEAVDTEFENCEHISFCELYNKVHIVSDCTFKKCTVSVDGENIILQNCRFFDVSTFFVTDSLVKDCIFKDIVADCTDEGVISMENGNISGCVFENIRLNNDAYLARGWGNAWIEKCEFKNITTSRKDGELFSNREVKGKIFKKVKEYCMVDDNCIGLN